MQTTLFYIHDPMCSWCWGYRPTWLKLQASLPENIKIKYLLGGLAADTDRPMSIDMQHSIAGHWRKIQTMLGTEFNFDFWDNCSPRRDTYKASRAVVVAAQQGLEEEMIKAIQHALLFTRNESIRAGYSGAVGQ
ncbi:MAG: DsbA family protein [Xanthomonadales bacterium]|nr:DsbA family protein [Xanthomonadales bacterium]